MNTSSIRQTSGTVMRGLVVVDAVVFLSAALLHLGLRVSIGPMVLALGRITDATIVEGLIAVLFAFSSYALLAHAPWAKRIVIGAHVFALVGVLVGLAAVFHFTTPDRLLNIAYHGVILPFLLAGLVLLLPPIPGGSTRSSDNSPAQRVTSA